MSGMVERLFGLFVAPGGPAAPVAAAAEPDAARAVLGGAHPGTSIVLLGGREAGDAAAAVGAALASAAHAPCAVVCLHGVQLGERPAAPRAAALAARLRDRGHVARARGRVVVVVLRGDQEAALAEAGRLTATLGTGPPDRSDVTRGSPMVLAFAGARGAALDARLAEHDAVVFTARGGAAMLDGGTDLRVADLAAARLRDRHAGLAIARMDVPAPVGPLRPGLRRVARAMLTSLR